MTCVSSCTYSVEYTMEVILCITVHNTWLYCTYDYIHNACDKVCFFTQHIVYLQCACFHRCGAATCAARCVHARHFIALSAVLC